MRTMIQESKHFHTEDTATDLSMALSQMCIGKPVNVLPSLHHSAGGCLWPLTFVTGDRKSVGQAQA